MTLKKHSSSLLSLLLACMSALFISACDSGGGDTGGVNIVSPNGETYNQPAQTLGGGIEWYVTEGGDASFEKGDLYFPDGVIIKGVKHYWNNAPSKLVYTAGAPADQQYFAFPDGTVMNWNGLQVKTDGSKILPGFGQWTLSADGTTLETSFGHKVTGGVLDTAGKTLTFPNGLVLYEWGGLNNLSAEWGKNGKNLSWVKLELQDSTLNIGKLPGITPSGIMTFSDGSTGKVKSISSDWMVTLEDGRIFMPSGGEGKVVPTLLQGKWLQIQNGQEVFLGAYSDLIYNQIDSNTLNITVGKNGAESIDQWGNVTVLESGAQYTIIKAGVDQVTVIGAVATLGSSVATGALSTKAATVNTIRLVDESNANNSVEATIDANGRFQMVAKSGNYRVQADDTTGRSVDTSVRVERAEVDLGRFTVTDSTSYNFKANISNPELVYFAAKNGQDIISYDIQLFVTNISANNVSGVTITVDHNNNPFVNSLTASPIIQGVKPGGAISTPVKISFKRPVVDQKVKLNVTIKDTLNNKTWTDYVVLNLSSKTPVPIYFSGHTQNWESANGYLIGPGRTLIPLSSAKLSSNWFNNWRSIRVPYEPGKTYNVVFANTSIDSEVPYGIGVGLPAAQADVDGFANAAKHEAIPASSSGGDNLFAGATKLKLFESDVSYVHVGDVDHYEVTFDATAIPYDPELVATPVLTGVNGLTGGGADTITNMVMQDNYAYVISYFSSSSFKKLHTFDLNNPKSPNLLNSINLGTTWIDGIYISGTTLSLVRQGVGTSIYDISDKTIAPVSQTFLTKGLVEPIITATNIYTLAPINTSGYKLNIYDASSPFTLLGSVDISTSTAGYPRGIVKSGNFIYAAFDAAGAYTIDVTNVANPTSAPLSAMTSAGFTTANSIKVLGGNLAISGWGKTVSGIATFDLTTPASPQQIGSIFNAVWGALGHGSLGNIIVSNTSPFTLSKFSPSGILDLMFITNPNGKFTGLSNDYVHFTDTKDTTRIMIYKLK